MTHYDAEEAQRSFSKNVGVSLEHAAYLTLVALRSTLGRGKSGQPDLVLEGRSLSLVTRYTSSFPLQLHIILHTMHTLILMHVSPWNYGVNMVIGLFSRARTLYETASFELLMANLNALHPESRILLVNDLTGPCGM